MFKYHFDLIQYFKIQKGLNIVNWYNPNRLIIANRPDGPSSAVRGCQHRVARQLTNCEPRKRFLSNRVVANWNKLPSEVVNSSNVLQFKSRFGLLTELSSLGNSAYFKNGLFPASFSFILSFQYS